MLPTDRILFDEDEKSHQITVAQAGRHRSELRSGRMHRPKGTIGRPLREDEKQKRITDLVDYVLAQRDSMKQVNQINELNGIVSAVNLDGMKTRLIMRNGFTKVSASLTNMDSKLDKILDNTKLLSTRNLAHSELTTASTALAEAMNTASTTLTEFAQREADEEVRVEEEVHVKEEGEDEEQEEQEEPDEIDETVIVDSATNETARLLIAPKRKRAITQVQIRNFERDSILLVEGQRVVEMERDNLENHRRALAVEQDLFTKERQDFMMEQASFNKQRKSFEMDCIHFASAWSAFKVKVTKTHLAAIDLQARVTQDKVTKQKKRCSKFTRQDREYSI